MKKAAFYMIYFLSPLFMIFVLYNVSAIYYTSLDMILALIFGVAAYNWFLWELILSSRPKFIDKLIGLDKMYRLHGIMALVSIGLAFSHKFVIGNGYDGTLVAELGDKALTVFTVISVLSLIYLAREKWKHYRIFQFAASIAEKLKDIKYQYFKFFHGLTLVSVILMQVHVILTSASRYNPFIFTMYMTYFSIAMGFYLYYKLVKPQVVKENKYRIVEIFKQSHDVWEIKMMPKGKMLKYKPGQFGFFSLKLYDDYEEHPFSFSSAPKKDGTLQITVKALGDFTEDLDDLEVGSEVYIDGPYGGFTYLDHPHEERLFFVAGGVGITPVYSMIKYLSYTEPEKEVTLLWGIRSQKDQIYKSEFQNLMYRMPNLQVVPVMSGDPTYDGETGFIDYDLLKKYKSTRKDYEDREGYYLCGPQILMDNSKKYLSKLGVKAYQIHSEEFSF